MISKKVTRSKLEAVFRNLRQPLWPWCLAPERSLGLIVRGAGLGPVTSRFSGDADRLPVRQAPKQAWKLDDADKAERLLRNLARRLELEAPDLSQTILAGLDEIMTVIRLGVPADLRRSLASTNIIESKNAAIRQICRNVKRWRDAQMVLPWTAACVLEAGKGFRRLKANKQLPDLKAVLEMHRAQETDAPDDPFAQAA